MVCGVRFSLLLPAGLRCGAGGQGGRKAVGRRKVLEGKRLDGVGREERLWLQGRLAKCREGWKGSRDVDCTAQQDEEHMEAQ